MRALLLALVLTGVARADGGTLRLSRASGPFVISVFTTPEPLYAGPADVSVLVQAREGTAVVLDAAVELRLRAPDGTEQALLATHAAATNRLLQAAPVELRAPGRWLLTVTARRGDTVATVSCALAVARASPRLGSQWLPLGLPAVCVLLFVWRERLLRRRPRRVAALSNFRGSRK
jgi:hypothetical protein